MIQKVFDAIQHFNKKLKDNKIAEISVKQSQVVFSFQDAEWVSNRDISILQKCMNPFEMTDITCFNNMLYISFRNLNQDIIKERKNDNNYVHNLYELIAFLKATLCTCPMLEYVVSEEYLKIYLDLNNIQLSNLTFLLEALHQDPFVEFSMDRPYLLYINESGINE